MAGSAAVASSRMRLSSFACRRTSLRCRASGCAPPRVLPRPARHALLPVPRRRFHCPAMVFLSFAVMVLAVFGLGLGCARVRFLGGFAFVLLAVMLSCCSMVLGLFGHVLVSRSVMDLVLLVGVFYLVVEVARCSMLGR